MNIWNFIKKDWAIFFRDRGAMLWLFILPLLFVTIFAGLARMSMGGATTEEVQDTRTPIPVVNLDVDGQLALQFLDQLDRVQGFKAEVYEAGAAEQALEQFKIRRYVVIPADFSARLSQGERVTLSLIIHPDADSSSTQTLVDILSGVGDSLSLELQILDGIRQMGEMQANNPEVQNALNSERVLEQAKYQFDLSRENPLVAVVERTPLIAEEKSMDLDLSASFVPGICVLFVFLASTSVARSLIDERKSGTLRRLMSAPLSRAALMAGKMVPVFLLTIIQIIVIFTVGAFLLPVMGFGRLAVGNDPLAWAITSILIALCSTCLGVLISTLAKTESQVNGIGNALLWIAGFLGGAIFPAVFLQQIPLMNVLMKFVPQSWAITAYYDVLTRGKGLADIWLNMAVLAGFSIVFFVIGVRRFKFE
jgi:ABC-2 type transport system permease protein